jgi:signal transduction histidine kinase
VPGWSGDVCPGRSEAGLRGAARGTTVGNVNSVWLRLRGLDAQRPWALDTGLAVLLFLAATLAATSPSASARPLDATLLVLLAVGSAPYAVRRRAPLPVLVIASVPVLAMVALGYGSAVIGAGLFFAAYTVAAFSGSRILVLAAGYVVLLLAAVVGLAPRSMPLGELATNASLFIGAFALGRSANDRRQNLALVQERAALAEQSRAGQARHAVADERLRIAQELHDVLAHSLGVIALQAGVGAHILDADPVEAKASLLTVADTSRSALTEVRRILGALRDPGDPTDPGDPATYHPPPGLDAVGDLAAELSAAGLPVRVHVVGERNLVPAALDLTAYRVIQEALTNVVKHAGPARAEVIIRYEPSALVLEVLDDGQEPAPTGRHTGHGQLGMRERVSVWGGSLTTGPRPAGGYRVAARLPYGDQDTP